MSIKEAAAFLHHDRQNDTHYENREAEGRRGGRVGNQELSYPWSQASLTTHYFDAPLKVRATHGTQKPCRNRGRLIATDPVGITIHYKRELSLRAQPIQTK